MKIGFVGLGKLGLPVGLAVESKGHEVRGYDPSPLVAEALRTRKTISQEAGADALLAKSHIQLTPAVEVLVEWSDLIFVAVQTPHEPEFGGETRVPAQRRDFDYRHLVAACSDLAAAIRASGVRPDVAVISTCLPGTMRREILPLFPYPIVYNPSFIAMGTTIQDFLESEMVLMGSDDPSALDRLVAFFGTVTPAPAYRTSVENAELAKVAYNTFIGLKLAFANTIMELCHALPGCDADGVLGALKLATRRVISTQYLSPGMGDGGACHPRDNIAMSHLARRVRLSYNLFDAVVESREQQTDWLAGLAADAHGRTGLPVVVLGEAYKPNSPLTFGSPAVLLANLLRERGVPTSSCDPVVRPGEPIPPGPAVFALATTHECFEGALFAPGSVVIDPWRRVRPQAGVTVVPVGRSPRP